MLISCGRSTMPPAAAAPLTTNEKMFSQRSASRPPGWEINAETAYRPGASAFSNETLNSTVSPASNRPL